MHTFRRSLRQSRLFILSFLLLETFYMVQGWNFVHAYQEHGKKQERLKEISEILDIPVEDLQPHSDGLYEQVRGLFVDDEDPVKAAGQERLREVLRKHEEQIANNPYRPQMEAVEQAHRLHRIEGSVNDLLQLTDPRNGKALARGAQRALLRNLHHGLKDGLELPTLRDDLPAKAQERQRAMQSKLEALVETVQPAVADFDGEAASTKELGGARPTGTVAQKVEQLRLFQAGAERKRRAPRFQERPLPNVLVVEKARVGDARSVGPTPPVQLKNPDAAQKSTVDPSTVDPAIIDPAIIALADALDHSPAAFYRYVLEEIAFDPKWGATKSPRGTLDEKLGTSWDQAWLLQQLLIASGVDARFEWGTVEITAEQLTNLVGIDDPWRAGDLLTTAGNPVVLVTEGSRVRTVRMQHAWVVAHLDYIPNRGVTPGPGDTWIRMDPTLVSMQWTDGLDIHAEVPFALEDYLLSGTEQSPRRYYEDALWSHIRANGIECATLDQLKRSGSVEREGVPFVPGTLRATVLDVAGQSTTAPADQQHRITLSVRRASDNAELLAWSSPWPAVYGQRLELAWPGATADDTATLEAYGGVFETPPYLVELAPEIRLDGTSVARGSSLGSAEDVEVFATLSSPMANAEPSLFQLAAGEPANFLVDYGHVPQSQVDTHRQSQLAASTDGNSELEDASTLALLGAQYLRNLGRDLADLGGWKRQRVVRLGTLGMTVQTGSVTTAVGGSPLTFTKNNRVIDIATMPLGLFPVDGSTNPEQVASLELLGSQSSYLEGEIFEEVIAHGGISAVTFLTHAVREGQTITRVDGSNIDAVLSTVDLGDDVEASIRDGIAQGKIAWVPESELTIRQWRGTGYVIEDPSTGAAGYLGTGGYGAGGDVGPLDVLEELLGSEPWFTNGPLQPLIDALLTIVDAIPNPAEPQTIQGDPVNLSNGNFLLTEGDLAPPVAGIPIQWTRTYNSFDRSSGPMGEGWSLAYGETLKVTEGGFEYREDDGSVHRFQLKEDGSYEGPPGKHLELIPSGSSLTLKTATGFIRHFDAQGRLESYEDPYGHRVTVEYGVDGPMSVHSSGYPQPILSMEYAEGLISRMTDHLGQSIGYTYSEGRLVSVEYPGGRVQGYAYDEQGRMIQRQNALGQIDTYAYDALGRLSFHVDRLGLIERFAYAPGKATMTDRRGHSKYFEMDDRGRATMEVGPLGDTRQVGWDESNNRTLFVDSRGATWTRSFDAQGQLVEEINPLGLSKRFTYEDSRLVAMVDEGGLLTEVEYDDRGLPVRTVFESDGVSRGESFEYDDFGRLTSHTDQAGRVTEMDYDPATGVLVRHAAAGAFERLFELDDMGRPKRISGEGATDLELEWSGGAVSAITDEFGYKVSAAYDAMGRLTQTSSIRGVSTREYDALDRLVRLTDELGGVMTSEYDPNGNLVASTDALQRRTTTIYDALDRPIAVIHASGHTWIMGHCAGMASNERSGSCQGSGCENSGSPLGGGEYCEVTDPLGQTTRRDYDLLGNVTRLVDPAGQVTEMEYDVRGHLLGMRDPMGRETRFEYDSSGRQTALIEPDGARTEYSYGGGHQLTEIVDANGNSRQFAYDPLGRLISESNALGQTTRHVYDSGSRVIERILPSGRSIQNVYEGSRLVGRTTSEGASEAFSYDTAGRRVAAINGEGELRFTYDALGRMASTENRTLGELISYEYDRAGNRTAMTSTNGRTEYIYGANNELVEMNDPSLGQFRFEYDPLGRRSRLIYPNGVETRYRYDEVGRLLSLTTQSEAGVLLDGESYTYDSVGNVMSRTSLRTGIPETLEYDDADRLTRWSKGETYREYSYDPVGNRTELLEPNRETTYLYDPGNRLLQTLVTTPNGSSETSYTWDEDGHRTAKLFGGVVTSYSYSAKGQLTGVSSPGGSTGYGYDALGRRIRETREGNDRFYLSDGANVVSIIESDGSRRSMTHGPAVDEILGEVSALQTTLLHHDGIGSVTSWTNDEGNLEGYRSYRPFGEVDEEAGALASSYGFAGREHDSTGLYYFRARYYDPGLGQFTSVDPVGSQFLHPRTLNGFDYGFSNPLRFKDPSGESPIARLLLGLVIGTVITVSAVNCVRTGVGFDCAFVLLGSLIPQASILTVKGYLVAVVVFLMSAVVLAITVLLGWHDGDFGLLAGLILFTYLLVASYVWTTVSLSILSVAASFPLWAGVEGVISLALVSIYGSFAYWAYQKTQEIDRF